jgi:hypothetical protein
MGINYNTEAKGKDGCTLGWNTCNNDHELCGILDSQL